MIMGRAELCSLIPHAGRMCLLDGVVSWDEQAVECVSGTHLDPDNPLRRNGKLSIVHSLEYGAQAMAVHGGLLARASGNRMSPGYLVAIRDARFGSLPWLDDIHTSLRVQARRLGGGEGDLLYQFEVAGNAKMIVTARATVMKRREAS